MDLARFTRVDSTTWRLDPHGTMRVPVIIYADEALIQDMDDKVVEQAANVATLPGIVRASYAMPDAHWGYGFRSAGWLLSIRTKAEWFRREESGSTFLAAFELC